ncbi:MAG TPA: Grx4 family monothiol glutaredoxin [Myxococcaceae bacterium]|nr:Grx4 family monothiol glutaredoxin [Myxococcaceae bacterium]
MTPELKARLDAEIGKKKVVLFMKGNALFPQCGFSARALQILQQHGEVHTVDVLADPEVRQGIKEYSNWPTIPQVFIDGKFVGGSDILMELEDRGELAELISGKAQG